jgi:Zn-dependent peptidase ImmA (M78 family)
MTDRFSVWEDLAERYPDITVDFCRLPSTHGVWVPTERTILINDALPPPARRSRLAHEVAHIDRGDRHYAHPYFNRDQEIKAEMLAAERVISLDDLAVSEVIQMTDRDLAEFLGVDQSLLTARMGGLTQGDWSYILRRHPDHEWSVA